MAGESVKKFNTIIQDQNPTRPALNTVPGTRQHAVTWPSINNACPTVGWNQYSSSDPILNFCNTSSSVSSCGSSSGDFFTTLMKIFTGATVGIGLYSSISSLVKSNKDNKATEGSGSSLANLTAEAENVDNKTSQSELITIADNLNKRIKAANTQLSNARRNKETATKTITNLNNRKTEWETKLTDFDAQKSTLESKITELEGQLATMSQDDPNYQDIKNKIENKKKELQDNYSDSKRNEITKQISTIEKDIAKWEKTRAEAQDLIDTLPKEIKNAEKALEKINKKINKKNND